MWLNPEITVWIYQDKVDMRKSINGLSIVVASSMKKDPNSGELFLFFNKGDKIKILYWDRNGFCMWYKRIEKGKFKMPRNKSQISYEQLRWLLDGLDIDNLQGHKALKYKNFF